MPTYEFRCPNGHDFDKFFRKISDAPSELPCPECGAVAARRVSGGAGLLFKGSGFYLTDYGKDAHRKPAPATPSAGDAKGAGAKSGSGDAPGGGASSAPEGKPSASKDGEGAGGSASKKPAGGE
jgi:putative FmdB family regulatory protein